MEIIRTVPEMQAWAKARRLERKAIGVVPTMGCLHDGHLSLIDAVRGAGAQAVVLTIFVNPTQFGPNEDLAKYPRDFERDLELCRSRKVDAVFAPDPSAMYAPDFSTWVEEGELSKGLCGRSRPGHFRGVATVVAKLFNATLPDIAVFGQKDAQQLRVIRRMARDLDFPVRILAAPIVREPDGLAMSSRNKYLSPDERRRALSLSKALFAAKSSVESSSVPDAARIVEDIEGMLLAAGARIDYVEIVDEETLEPVSGAPSRPVLFAVAAFFGATRLIDNIVALPR